MPRLSPRLSQFRALAHAAGIVAGALCISVSGAANENEKTTRPPYHPYLAPAPPLMEMDTGGPVDRGMVRSVRVLFPELAQGTLPETEFGAISLTFSGSVVLFREADGGGTLVETREMKRGSVFLSDLTQDETPAIVTKSRILHPDIATASVSAIRRALKNARPNPTNDWVVLDGVSYYFFSRGSTGRAHSPDSDTEAGTLCRLVHVLAAFADGNAQEREVKATVEDALAANHGSGKGR